MELTFYEDPACTWCWAFQPVSTAFAFEFGDAIRVRRVMGGLRDWPAADVGFVAQQWKKAEAVSGMPFEVRIWKKHVLRTTFVACRAVKAAGMINEVAAHRLLRRLREALFVQQILVDDVENILRLGAEVGIDREQLEENISSGRAETLFARDRSEAAQYGFGFPTIMLRDGRVEHPVLLQGVVSYNEVVQALLALGVSPKLRRRFRDATEHWASLFAIHPRLTFAEIQKVTQMERAKLLARMEALGIRRSGVFYEIPSPEAGSPAPAAAAAAQGATSAGAVAASPAARPSRNGSGPEPGGNSPRSGRSSGTESSGPIEAHTAAS